jgi:hypothetical protein
VVLFSASFVKEGERGREGEREGVFIFVIVVAQILVVWAREGGRKEGRLRGGCEGGGHGIDSRTCAYHSSLSI